MDSAQISVAIETDLQAIEAHHQEEALEITTTVEVSEEGDLAMTTEVHQDKTINPLEASVHQTATAL